MTGGGKKKKEMQDRVHKSNMQFNIYPINYSNCLLQLVVTCEINYRFYDQGVYLSDAN